MLTVFTNGCFDIIHRGHIELLEYCKSLGSVTVGLNSDASVKKLKGKNRPINSEADRKKLLESLKTVDRVIIFGEETPYELIKKINPDLIVKGGDYKPKEVVGSDICEVSIFNYISGYSSTRILERANLIIGEESGN
jgi:D-beta-D-heptose 7-phosphate kinase/D-beta-D-heptose 1-phosphate adenosyltransferase